MGVNRQFVADILLLFFFCMSTKLKQGNELVQHGHDLTKMRDFFLNLKRVHEYICGTLYLDNMC